MTRTRVLLSGGPAGLQRSLATALGRAHEVVLWGPGTADADDDLAEVDPQQRFERVTAETPRGDVAVVVDESIGRWGEEGGGNTKSRMDALRSAGVRRVILVTRATASQAPAPSSFQEWLTIRAPGVYGITEDPITLYLILLRSLPAVPVSNEAHVVAPLWHEDLADAVAAAVSLPVAAINRAIHVAGPDAVTQQQLYDRITGLIDRRPLAVPIPDFVARHGARLMEILHLTGPLDTSRFRFPDESAESHAPAEELRTVFGVTPIGIDQGLQRIVQTLAEVTPAEGVGSLEVKRFAVDIQGSRYDAAELLRRFRARFKEVMAIKVGVEPAAPDVQLEPGEVLTMALPGRGHVQVRVEHVQEDQVIVGTLRGHAVAGIVRFSTRTLADGVRFEVMTCDRPANALDWIALTLGGAQLQNANWAAVVRNVSQLAGGTAGEVRRDQRKLSADEAGAVEGWIEALIRRQPDGPIDAPPPVLA